MLESNFFLITDLLFQHTFGIYGHRLVEQFKVCETHGGGRHLKLYLGRIKGHYAFVAAEIQFPVLILKSGFEAEVIIKSGNETNLIIPLLNAHDSFLSPRPNIPFFIFQQAYNTSSLCIGSIHRDCFKYGSLEVEPDGSFFSCQP